MCRKQLGAASVMLALAVTLTAGLGGCGKGKEAQQGESAAGGSSADLYARGEAAYLARNDAEAFALLGEIPDGAPEKAKAHNLRGLIQARGGNMALATIEFNEALKADPSFAQAHNNLGVLHLSEGRPEEAIPAFQAAIKADTYYLPPHQGLAEAYYKTGRLDDAKAELRVAEELARSQAASSAAVAQDLQIGQPLDVAELIAQEETAAAKPKPKPAAPAQPATKPAPPKPTTKIVTTQVSAPAGTQITIALDQALSTETNKTGEAVQGRVVGTVMAGADTLIRAGAPVKGTIANAKSAGRVKGQSELAIAFTEVMTVAGWREIQAHMVEGTLKGGSSIGKDAAKVGIGAAAGAAIGGIVGGKAGTGAAIGGAAGTAAVLATKGKEIELAPGTSMGFALDQPLSVTVEKTVPAN